MPSIVSELISIISKQTAMIDLQAAQIDDLTLALGLDKTGNVQTAFDVSESLAQLLILLSDGKPRNKEQLHGALYFRRPDVDSPEVKILDTLACKLRKCVRPFGIEIETIWSGGYRISAGLHVVQAAMEHSDPYGGIEGARRRRLEYFRERQRRLRAAEGRKDRQSYLQGSLSRQKPWQAEGIDRATWYRRRATRLSAANDDTVVASENRATQVVA